MAYKEYTRYMNERLTKTSEGRKSLEEYNKYKKTITELPQKIAKIAVEKVKKVPKNIISNLGKITTKVLPTKTIIVK